MTKKCSIPPDNPQPLTLAQRGNWVDGESLAEMLKKKGLAVVNYLMSYLGFKAILDEV